MSRENIKLLVCSIPLAFFACFIFDTYLNPLLINSGDDCSVFLQMGLAISKGEIPYVDLFDHKGILLYWIQALGIFVSKGHWGVFGLALINLSLCIFIWFKTSRLFVSPKRSWLVVAVLVLIFGVFSDRGNNPEEWALLYVSFCNYLFLRIIVLNRNVTYLECLTIGACLGILFFIKLNSTAPILCSCLILAYLYIKTKQYKELFYSTTYVFIGGILILAIVTLTFGIVYGFSYIYDLYYGTILFNLEYVANAGNGSILDIPLLIFILCFVICFSINRKGNDIIFQYTIMAYCLLCLTLSKAYFYHYFIVSIPILLPLVSLILASNHFSFLYSKIFRWRYVLACVAIFSFVFVSILVKPKIEDAIKRGEVYERGYHDFYSRYQSLSEDEKENIWNYNARFNGLNALYTINAVQMNRIILPSQLQVSSTLLEKAELREKKPLRILIDEKGKWYRPSDSAFVKNNYYVEYVVRLQTESCNNCLIYKRIE